ncbi:MAG TPA: Ig-like domain-containing protein, partial [Candidatus Limiplasma sp.]|nr:Ig-like domain-containing protein [Candidatus Limiplasma sp.]
EERIRHGFAARQPVLVAAGLTHTVYPAETSNQAVTYKVGNKYIASIDENGVVTALKGGTTTVTVTAADGSKKYGTAKITVLVPVTGVSYSRTDVRVGEGHYNHVTVSLAPSNATNNTMTWVSADESIATVSGNTNTCKIVGGNSWGRTTITGTTEDGGYTITLNVNVGSLYNAVSVYNLTIYNGKPYITLQNNSGMVITQVRYFMQGLNSSQQIIPMSTTGDVLTLYGSYDLPLNPGEQTQHGLFTFYSPSDYPDLTYLFIIVTGWSTSTGYYDSYGNLNYTYNIPEDYQELIIYPYNADPALFQSNG